MISPKPLALLLLNLASLAIGLPAAAELTRPPQVLEGKIRPGWKIAAGAHMAAIDLRLAPEWKTYWRAPGDAGIPPSFDWSGSENLAAIRFHWPAPELFHSNGMRSVGYHDQLVLPFEAIAQNPAKPIKLKAKIDFGICKDICIPASFALMADLPTQGKNDPVIRQALNASPSSANKAGLKSIRCRLEPIRDGMRLTAELDLAAQGRDEMVVFEPGLPGLWVSESEVTRAGRSLTAVADLVPSNGQPFALNRKAMLVTVIGDQGRAVEIQGCPSR